MTKEVKVDNKTKLKAIKEQVAEKMKLKKEKKANKVEELEKQVADLKNDYLRSIADFDNFRKRKEKEMISVRERVLIDFVLDILPSIDNFEMSLKMTDNKEMFIKGVEMIHTNLINTLKDNKFEEFEPKIDEEFNPHMHDPVLIEDKTKEAGKVITILKKGYKFKDTIVRPARVQVVKQE